MKKVLAKRLSPIKNTIEAYRCTCTCTCNTCTCGVGEWSNKFNGTHSTNSNSVFTRKAYGGK